MSSSRSIRKRGRSPTPKISLPPIDTPLISGSNQSKSTTTKGRKKRRRLNPKNVNTNIFPPIPPPPSATAPAAILSGATTVAAMNTDAMAPTTASYPLPPLPLLPLPTPPTHRDATADVSANKKAKGKTAKTCGGKSLTGRWVVYYSWEDRGMFDMTLPKYELNIEMQPNGVVAGNCIEESGPYAWTFILTGTLKKNSLTYTMHGEEDEIYGRGIFEGGDMIRNGTWFQDRMFLKKGGKLIAYRKGCEPSPPHGSPSAPQPAVITSSRTPPPPPSLLTTTSPVPSSAKSSKTTRKRGRNAARGLRKRKKSTSSQSTAKPQKQCHAPTPMVGVERGESADDAAELAMDEHEPLKDKPGKTKGKSEVKAKRKDSSQKAGGKKAGMKGCDKQTVANEKKRVRNETVSDGSVRTEASSADKRMQGGNGPSSPKHRKDKSKKCSPVLPKNFKRTNLTGSWSLYFDNSNFTDPTLESIRNNDIPVTSDVLFVTHDCDTNDLNGFINSPLKCRVYGYVDNNGIDIYLKMIWSLKPEYALQFAGFVTILHGEFDCHNGLNCEYYSFNFSQHYNLDLYQQCHQRVANRMLRKKQRKLRKSGSHSSNVAAHSVGEETALLGIQLREKWKRHYVPKINALNNNEDLYVSTVRTWLENREITLNPLGSNPFLIQPPTANSKEGSHANNQGSLYTYPPPHYTNQCIWKRLCMPQTQTTHVQYRIMIRKEERKRASRARRKRKKKRRRKSGYYSNDADTESTDAQMDGQRSSNLTILREPKNQDCVFHGRLSSDFINDDQNRNTIFNYSCLRFGDCVQIKFRDENHHTCCRRQQMESSATVVGVPFCNGNSQIDSEKTVAATQPLSDNECAAVGLWHDAIVMCVFRNTVRVKYKCGDRLCDEWVNCSLDGVLLPPQSKKEKKKNIGGNDFTSQNMTAYVNVRLCNTTKFSDDIELVLANLNATAESRWRDGLDKGCECLACDNYGQWFRARITTRFGPFVYVHYDEWDDRFDEWLDIYSDRLKFLHVSDIPNRFRNRYSFADSTVLTQPHKDNYMDKHIATQINSTFMTSHSTVFDSVMLHLHPVTPED